MRLRSARLGKSDEECSGYDQARRCSTQTYRKRFGDGEPSIPSRPGTIVHDRRLNSESLRFNLLFWDRLEEPLDFDDTIGLVGDTRRFLLSQGIMQKSHGIKNPPRANHIERYSVHLKVYRELMPEMEVAWSFARHERSTLSLPIDEVEQDRGILLKLYQVIPIHHRDVPLADVLEFKAKRQSELLDTVSPGTIIPKHNNITRPRTGQNHRANCA